MTEKNPQGTPNIFPCLCYEDAPAALEWLAKAFGFEKLHVYPGPDGTIAHAEMRLGPGIIMLSSVTSGSLEMKTPRQLGGVSQCIFIHVRDVDAHYERARAAGAEIVRVLEDKDYGSRDYVARDPEGNLWSFGTYMPET